MTSLDPCQHTPQETKGAPNRRKTYPKPDCDRDETLPENQRQNVARRRAKGNANPDFRRPP